MFRPLKNFLTYLQKNTNGTPIFGNSSNMNQNPDCNMLPADNNSLTKSDSTPNQNEPNKITGTSSPIITSEVIELDNNDENDNKELTQQSTSKDYFENCNVISIELDDNSENELQTEEFPAGEVLLLDDNLNTSFPLDPITDPLAIEEDFQNEIVNNDSLTIKSSSVSDIVSTDGNILYIIDVEDIKEQGIKIDEINTDGNKSLITNTSSLQNSVASVEEQELRSDGSDSGLGSETSVLQTTVNTCNSIQLESSIKVTIPSYSNLKRRSENDTILCEKRPKRSINFDGVKIYYFPRIQGFACVPSQGGCTLGMGSRHIHLKTFTLAEHAAEQRRTHKLQMQEINPRGSSSEESDSDDELSDGGSSSDLDTDANGFLQPVPAKQRRALLKAAGVRKIDPLEKDECRAIRSSREFCGCNCRGYCDPDSCSCSQAGIKCQVDRPNFPCGCTRDGCANIIGRVEFNPGRVRTHFIHTIMRLDLENKQTRTDNNIHLGSLHNSNSILYGNNNCETNKLCGSVYNSSDDNIRGQLYNQVQHTSYNQNYMNHNDVVTTTSAGCFFDHQQQQSQTDTRINNQQNVYGFQMTTNNDNTHMIDYSTVNNQLHYYNDRTSASYFMSNSYQNQNYSNYQSNYNHNNYLNTPQNNSPDINEIHKQLHTKKDNELTANKYISLNSLSGNTTQIDAINDLLHNNRNTPPVKSIKNSTNLEINCNVSLNDDTMLIKPMVPITMAHIASSSTLAPSANTHLLSTSITEGTSTSISTSYNANEISINNNRIDISTVTSKTINIDENIDDRKKMFIERKSQSWAEEKPEVESTTINHINKEHSGCDIDSKITNFLNENSSTMPNQLAFKLENEIEEKEKNNEDNNPTKYYDITNSENNNDNSNNFICFPSENENQLTEIKDEVESAFA